MTDTEVTALVRGLAAAALSPGLRSVLCFDARPNRLLGIAVTFAQLLEAAEGLKVRRVMLGSSEHEEGLWTALDWTGELGALSAVPVSGRLGPPAKGTLTLVVVPDLARLSLVAARAAVMLVDADVAHIERDGLSIAWRPTTAWLAGCATGEVGRISPHLLDRFALRLQLPDDLAGAREGGGSRPGRLHHDASPEETIEVSPDLLDAVRQGRTRSPGVTREALATVLSLVPSSHVGARRALALGRFAAATARLEGAGQVTSEHALAAADVLGIAVPELEPGPVQVPNTNAEASVASSAGTSKRATPERVVRDDAAYGRQTLIAADSETELDAGSLLDQPLHPDPRGEPYPEDDAGIDRELEPLREPPHHGTLGIAGMPIGTQQARGLRDLALTSTVLQAAKFQVSRRRSRPDATGLLLTAADLRSYRRSPPAEEMLALVLDFTCRADWAWTTALQPYLTWAYPRRASVCLVRVGARDAANELQAERILARNLLDPRLAVLLEVPAGRATPLAHGLELARQALQHALHHGRAGLSSARLVVVTDGRGNVPLQASLTGRNKGAVAQEGITDALLVAEQLVALDRVRVTVVDPASAVLADLPRVLARALNAELDVSLAVREVGERAS